MRSETIMTSKFLDLSRGLSTEHWLSMAKEAWKVREYAYIIGKTKVGAVALTKTGITFGGCNVEHIYRCHDVHAEVNAITSMVAAGYTDLAAILVVAEREFFTPCGGCMDWIFQFGSEECLVAYQSKKDGEIRSFQAKDLMPYYPK